MSRSRTQRVPPLNSNDIMPKAVGLCSVLGFPPKAEGARYDKCLEMLSTYNVTLNIVEDDEWRRNTLGSILGHCDPVNAEISLPESTYLEACEGDSFALEIIFHELGHLILGHKALLHYSSNAPVSMQEDPEYQADLFAYFALDYLGFNPKAPLSLVEY